MLSNRMNGSDGKGKKIAAVGNWEGALDRPGTMGDGSEDGGKTEDVYSVRGRWVVGEFM